MGLDVRDAAKVEEWTNQTIKELGPLNGAANCAGVSVHFLERSTGYKLSN